MKQKNKRIVLWAFLIYACANLAVYLASHFAPYINNDVIGVICEYLAFYLLKALEFIAPPIIATLMLVIFTHKDLVKAISAALVISSARIFYFLPYLYIETFYEGGSLYAILISLIGCIRITILTAAGAYISLCIGLIALRLALKRSYQETISMLPELLERKSDLDFLKPENLPIMIFALLRFVLDVIMEIIDTVSFFISEGADYSAIDIFTMLFNYVWLFALLVAAYLIACRIKDALRGFAAKEESSTEDFTVQ